MLKTIFLENTVALLYLSMAQNQMVKIIEFGWWMGMRISQLESLTIF